MNSEERFYEDKRTYLGLIQGVIDRMAGNLFFLKGWAVAIIVGVLALAITFLKQEYQLVILIPLLILWWLDSYFLSLERCYRSLYDEVRQFKPIDENGKAREIDFSLNPTPYKKHAKNTIVFSMFSLTLMVFYPILIAMAIIIPYLTKPVC